MILTCPNCTTRFLLSAFVLAPDGRKVKCTNCSETWFQLPDPEELNAAPEEKPQDIPESVKPIPRGSSVPAVRDDEDRGKISAGKIAIAAAVSLILLGGIFIAMKDIIMAAVPTTLPIYKTLGVVSTLPGEGLVFDRLQAVTSENSETPMIFLSGSVINLSPLDVSVPNMLAELRGKDGQTIKAVLIKPPLDKIPAEDIMPFEAAFEDDGLASEIYVRFTLGSPSSVSTKAPVSDDHAEEAAHHGDGHGESHDQPMSIEEPAHHDEPTHNGDHHEEEPHATDTHEEPAHSSGHH